MLGIETEQPSREELNKRIEQQMKDEKTVVTKEQTIELLTAAFADVRKSIEEMRPAIFTREAQFFGTKTTRRGILINLDVHVAEHLGQAIAYARMNGIVPPW
jgi:uncharacterized damage-inducible protein DinB